MRITVKYFGQITDITQREEETLEFSGSLVSDLLDALYSTYKDLNTKDFQVALDQEIVTLKTKITEGEVALLPPFSGG